MMSEKDVSVVLPLYNNSTTLPELVRRLAASLTEYSFEVIGIDDASPDDSGEVLAREAALQNVSCTVVKKNVNEGQNQALVDGIRETKGRAVVIMDADLQDPPETVPDLLNGLNERRTSLSFGLRSGKYQNRFFILASRLFKWILFRLAGSDFPVRVGLFMALDAEMRDRVQKVQFTIPYVLGYLTLLKPSWTYAEFNRPAQTGKSNYRLLTRFQLAFKALAFTIKYKQSPALSCYHE